MRNYSCAGCRRCRMKCGPDCSTAPYFPAHMPKNFESAYKVFGRSNIVKILNSIDSPYKRGIAMKNLIAEAHVRSSDPVGGCSGLLMQQRVVMKMMALKISEQEQELSHLRSQLGNIASSTTRQEQGYGIVEVNLGGESSNARQGYDQEQGNSALQEQGDSALEFGHQEHGNSGQGYLQRFEQDQTNIVDQSQAYVHPSSHHQHLLPEPNQLQGNVSGVRNELDVPESRPNSSEQNSNFEDGKNT